MKVKATKVGFYDKYRRPGDVFEIKNASELGSWMEKVKAPAKPKAKAKIKE